MVQNKFSIDGRAVVFDLKAADIIKTITKATVTIRT